MGLTFRIIMPCGGVHEDISNSLDSVNKVANALHECSFVVYRIFNNGLVPNKLDLKSWNFDMQDLDINPTASAALARNKALDLISELRNISTDLSDFTIFLDAGDLLLPDLITKIMQLDFQKKDIFVGSAIIRTENKDFERVKVPLELRYFINPIYLGSAICKTSLVTSNRFIDGRKEDWKFWLEILDKNPKLVPLNEKNYIYTIVNRGNHSLRKGKLFREQFNFYNDYLNFSRIFSSFMMACHYVALFNIWWIIMPIKRIIRNLLYKYSFNDNN